MIDVEPPAKTVSDILVAKLFVYVKFLWKRICKRKKGDTSGWYMKKREELNCVEIRWLISKWR